MTATIETAPATLAPVMVTADGEAREAETWGQDSYSCAFCQSPVFGPLDWEQHERDNAEHYAKRGEEYTAEPYSYRARYWDARECANPMCLSALSAERLAQIREQQRRDAERKAIAEREQAEREAKAKAAAERKSRGAELLATVGPMGRQLGFAWACAHEEPAKAYGAEPEMCEASGWARDEYLTHMRGHGAKVTHSAVKLPKLRKRAPAASLPKLPCSPFKFITWTDSHTEPATCKHCGHEGREHLIVHGSTLANGVGYDCEACDCEGDVYPFTTRPETQTADRRGQFWALGPDAHSVWVIPFSAAPWESGRPAPVLLYAGKPGSFHTSSYSAKYDRR